MGKAAGAACVLPHAIFSALVRHGGLHGDPGPSACGASSCLCLGKEEILTLRYAERMFSLAPAGHPCAQGHKKEKNHTAEAESIFHGKELCWRNLLHVKCIRFGM